MLLNNRHGSVDSDPYRYGFNGMEKDDEVKGQGNSYTTYFRKFDPRLGRAFSLDPIMRSGTTMYGMMSNNPIIMIDPRGDDDYYNERGEYLYTDTKNSNDIKLITQEQFNKIVADHGRALYDRESSSLELIKDLEQNSREITVNIKGQQFKDMLKDSRLDRPVKDRKEQLSLIVLDVEKAEIRLERQGDSKNDEDTSYSQNAIKSAKDGKVIWIGPVEGEEYWKRNENIVIIGQVHTHPVEYGELKTEGVIPIPSRQWQPDDKNASDDWGAVFFQLYPESVNQVDAVIPNSKGGSIDNITTTKAIKNNQFDIGRKALEITGNKPQQTTENKDKKKP